LGLASPAAVRDRGSLPWARPRHELPLLGLVGFAALSSVYRIGTQDVTRLCLTHAVLHGHLTIEPCARNTMDFANHGGGVYSDKAPGLSFLALPAASAVGLFSAEGLVPGDWRIWLVRLATSGLAFLALAFLVGRISEGIVPGLGGAALVALALGTYIGPLAATSFDHVAAAAFAFGGFVLAWSRRYALAGLSAALAVDTNYLCALIGIAVAAYVLVAGVRPLLRFAAGAAVPLILLGAYNWAAFGSPFHLSYRYVGNKYAARQQAGFFGIHVPNAHGVTQVFLGDRGILIAAPVIAAAAAGTVLLARRYRPEAIVCLAVFAAFVLVNSGYFLPYGGQSPGPRFLVPALPFIALGLAPAFAKWFRTVTVLAGASIVAMTGLMLSWRAASSAAYRGTIWGAIARTVSGSKHSLFRHAVLARNALQWVGVSRIDAVALICLAVGAAYALALSSHIRRPRPLKRTIPGLREKLLPALQTLSGR
jgi:hypothetical protein